MKKFCCERFSFHYMADNQVGMNIRVLKLSKAFIERGNLSFDKSFMITDGYTNDVFNSKNMVIEFCPFCSTNLKSFYKSDEYVQENIDVPKRK